MSNFRPEEELLEALLGSIMHLPQEARVIILRNANNAIELSSRITELESTIAALRAENTRLSTETTGIVSGWAAKPEASCPSCIELKEKLKVAVEVMEAVMCCFVLSDSHADCCFAELHKAQADLQIIERDK